MKKSVSMILGLLLTGCASGNVAQTQTNVKNAKQGNQKVNDSPKKVETHTHNFGLVSELGVGSIVPAWQPIDGSLLVTILINYHCPHRGETVFKVAVSTEFTISAVNGWGTLGHEAESYYVSQGEVTTFEIKKNGSIAAKIHMWWLYGQSLDVADPQVLLYAGYRSIVAYTKVEWWQ